MNAQKLLETAIALAPKVKAISAEVLASHIQRDDIVEAFWLALISGRPAFFLGGFGIDKTGTIRSIVRYVDGLVFYDELIPNVGSPEQLFVDETEIEEAVDERGAKHIRVREKLGKAANAHIVFFDEKYKPQSPQILHAVIDLTKGDGIRHEGQMVVTPLLTSLGASNEIPGGEDNLGANWSRETIRVHLRSLDRGGKTQFVAARLSSARNGKKKPASVVTLADVEALRSARPFVEVPQSVVDIVLDIYQALLDEDAEGFEWLWDDDRRFGRVFDVLQAHALLEGRDTVIKTDLKVLEWLLWDTPEQIPTVLKVIAPYSRTPLDDAQEHVDALLAPGGKVARLLAGDRTVFQIASQELSTALEGDKSGNSQWPGLAALKQQAVGDEADAIEALIDQVQKAQADALAIMLGQRI